MVGTLGTCSLIDVVVGLAGNTSTRVAGHALGDAAVGALLVDEESSEGAGAAESAAVVILGVQALDLRAGEVVGIGQVVCRGAFGANLRVSAAAEIAVAHIAGIGQHASVDIVNICDNISTLTGSAGHRISTKQAVADLAAAGNAVALGV